MKHTNGERYLWLVAGLGLGAGITYLFASKEGRKARRRFVRMMEDGTERLVERSEEVLERGKEFYERGREMADEAMEFIDRGRRAAQK